MRKRRAIKRDVLPDPIYNSKVITKLINQIMLDGKRGKAQKIVYNAFDMVQERTNENPLDVFTKAMENITPSLEIKSRRIGGANYSVPVEVESGRAQALALRWLTNASRSRNGHSMAEKLANEIVDASKETGAAFKKKEDTHKMAEANKAFAHYRW